MFDTLNKPYPLESLKTRLVMAFSISLFVYLFLVILEPFDLNQLEHNKSIIIVGYGVLCVAVLITNYAFLPLLLPALFNDSKWKVYKEIIWLSHCLIILGFGITVYEDLIGTRPFEIAHVADSILQTSVIGIISIAAITFFNQNRLLKKHSVEARDLSDNLRVNSDSHKNSSIHKVIEFKSENINESFSCSINNLLSISAMGNYVIIHTVDDGEMVKTILRCSLSLVEHELYKFPEIYRCHRGHLINLNKVEEIKGNANGYNLFLGVKNLVIPVSKRKTSEFKARISGK